MTFDFRTHMTTKAIAVHSLVKTLKEKRIPLFQRLWQHHHQPVIVTITSSLSLCILTLLGRSSFTFTFSHPLYYSCYSSTALLLTTFLILSQRNSAFVASFAWTASATAHTNARTVGPTSVVIHNPHPSSSTPSPSESPSPSLIHFIFLVHGYQGMSADLSYLQENLKSKIEKRVYKTNKNKEQQPYRNSKVVIHNSIANEYRTKDGIESGGDRLLQEILHVIRSHSMNQDTIRSNNSALLNQIGTEKTAAATQVTLSIIGNSLGGIYSRYAIAKLAAMSSNTNTNSTSSDNTNSHGDNIQDSFLIDHDTIQIHFNIFCTTATPHLGIARHTWLKIPRFVEISIAHLLGQTGKDLFLMTDLLKRMTTTEYLRPLAAFRRRILYANAFHTDFVVPCQTASFLHENSTVPHYSFSDNDITSNSSSNNNKISLDESSSSSQQQHVNLSRLFVTTLHTRSTSKSAIAQHSSRVFPTFNKPSNQGQSRKAWREFRKNQSWEWTSYENVHQDVLLEMSQSLDSLGWKKVFIDVRKEIPIPIRLPISSISKPSRNILGQSLHSSNIILQRQQEVYESRDIANALSLPDTFMAFPIGHNMMVAFSRTPFTSYFYRGGRPIVDQLAYEFVDEMLKFTH